MGDRRKSGREKSDVIKAHGIELSFVGDGKVPVVIMETSSPFHEHASCMLQAALDTGLKVDGLYEYYEDDDVVEDMQRQGMRPEDMMTARIKANKYKHCQAVGASGKRSALVALVISLVQEEGDSLTALFEFLETYKITSLLMDVLPPAWESKVRAWRDPSSSQNRNGSASNNWWSEPMSGANSVPMRNSYASSSWRSEPASGPNSIPVTNRWGTGGGSNADENDQSPRSWRGGNRSDRRSRSRSQQMPRRSKSMESGRRASSRHRDPPMKKRISQRRSRSKERVQLDMSRRGRKSPQRSRSTNRATQDAERSGKELRPQSPERARCDTSKRPLRSVSSASGHVKRDTPQKPSIISQSGSAGLGRRDISGRSPVPLRSQSREGSRRETSRQGRKSNQQSRSPASPKRSCSNGKPPSDRSAQKSPVRSSSRATDKDRKERGRSLADNEDDYAWKDWSWKDVPGSEWWEDRTGGSGADKWQATKSEGPPKRGSKWAESAAAAPSMTAEELGVDLYFVGDQVPVVNLDKNSCFYESASWMLQSAMSAEVKADALYSYANDKVIMSQCRGLGLGKDEVSLARMNQQDLQHIQGVGVSGKRATMMALVLALIIHEKIDVEKYIKEIWGYDRQLEKGFIALLQLTEEAQHGGSSAGPGSRSPPRSLRGVVERFGPSPGDVQARSERQERFSALHSASKERTRSRSPKVKQEGGRSRSAEVIKALSTDEKPIEGSSTDVERPFFNTSSVLRAEDIRPEKVLRVSFELICKKWSDTRDWVYAGEMLRSIRQDLTLQMIRNAFTVKVYEFCARAALIAGDVKQFEQCTTQLEELYNLPGLAAQGNPLEILSFRLLYLALEGLRGNGVNQVTMTSFLKQHGAKFRTAIANGNEDVTCVWQIRTALAEGKLGKSINFLHKFIVRLVESGAQVRPNIANASDQVKEEDTKREVKEELEDEKDDKKDEQAGDKTKNARSSENADPDSNVQAGCERNHKNSDGDTPGAFPEDKAESESHGMEPGAPPDVGEEAFDDPYMAIEDPYMVQDDAIAEMSPQDDEVVEDSDVKLLSKLLLNDLRLLQVAALCKAFKPSISKTRLEHAVSNDGAHVKLPKDMPVIFSTKNSNIVDVEATLVEVEKLLTSKTAGPVKGVSGEQRSDHMIGFVRATPASTAGLRAW